MSFIKKLPNCLDVLINISEQNHSCSISLYTDDKKHENLFVPCFNKIPKFEQQVSIGKIMFTVCTSIYYKLGSNLSVLLQHIQELNGSLIDKQDLKFLTQHLLCKKGVSARCIQGFKQLRKMCA